MARSSSESSSEAGDVTGGEVAHRLERWLERVAHAPQRRLVILAADREADIAFLEGLVRGFALAAVRRAPLEVARLKRAPGMLPSVSDAAGDERLDADAKIARGDSLAAAAAGAATSLGVLELREAHGCGRRVRAAICARGKQGGSRRKVGTRDVAQFGIL